MFSIWTWAEYICAGNSPVQSPACTGNLKHNKVKMSQVDGQPEITLLCTKLLLLILKGFYQQKSSRSQLQQRDSCSPTLIMEVVEVEKESQEGEEKERAANMTAVSSIRCGKVIRKRKLHKVCSWTQFWSACSSCYQEKERGKTKRFQK